MTDQNKSWNGKTGLSDDNSIITMSKIESDAMAREINYLREIVKMKTEGIIRYDQGLYIREWNPYMEELTWLRKEEVIGKCITELSIFDNQDIVYKLDEILKWSEWFKFEHEINVRNKKSFLVSNTSNPLFNEKWNIDWIVSTIRDISEQKELQHDLETHQIELQMQNEQLKVLNDFLQTSQSKYFELYDLAPIGYCTIDENGIFYNFNLKISSMVWVTKEDIKRRNFNSFIFQEDINKYILFIRDIFKTNTQKSCEVRMLKADWNVFWCNISANIIQDENNQKKCNLSIIDITLQKLEEETRIRRNNLISEKALSDKDELLNQFLKKSPIYAYIKDITNEESRVLNASDNYKDMIWIEAKDMIGKSMEELFPEDLAKKMTADDLSVVEKGEVFSIQEELKGGHFLTIKFPITLSNRTLLAWYTIDITEQKKLEEELQKSNRIVKMISECNQVVTQVNTEQELLDSICRIITGLGGYRMAWIGYKIDDEAKNVNTAAYCWFEEGFLDSLKITWDENKNSGLGAVWTAIRENRLVFNDNTLTDPIYATWRERAKNRWYSSSVAIPISINNSIIGIISVYSTEDEVFKEEEVKLLKDLSNSLSRWIQFFREKKENEMFVQRINSQDKINAIGELAWWMAHDFNNVLTILKWNLELLRLSCTLTEEQNKKYMNILYAIDRLTEIVKKIQYLSKKAIIEKKNFDIHNVASEVFNMLKDSIDKIIRLEINFKTWEYYVDWSESCIHQVFLNLAINSSKAFAQRWSKDGDFIRISVDDNLTWLKDFSDSTNFIHIAFKDNWPWMSNEVIEKAFDPYFTTWNISWQGWEGLWLTSVYNIVTSQHLGYIYINSKVWAWTTVHFYLPKWISKKIIPWKEDELIWWGETILVVDDEIQIQNVLKDLLNILGYKVLIAGDWNEAVETYEKMQSIIDLVMMDIRMPNLSWLDALKLMLDINNKVKVIICSWQSSEFVRKWDLDWSKWYISKPFSLDKLTKVIRDVLDEK